MNLTSSSHQKSEYDVIVVGAGGSGLAAAVSAAQAGLSVVVLEKEPQLGGTTGIAIGSFTAAGTRQQRSQKIDDDAGHHTEDVAQFAPAEIEARNNHELRAFFLSHAADTLAWLEQMGLQFYGPSPEPPNRVPRMHNVVPNAKAYIHVLQSALRRAGGRIVCGARVVELSRTGARVTGCIAETGEMRSSFAARRGVILAAGDYAHSAELIGRFKGTRFAEIDGINTRATGDGQRLVESVGGTLVNMDVTYGPELRFIPPPTDRDWLVRCLNRISPDGFLARLTSLVPRVVTNALIKRLLVTWQHPEDSLFGHGAILVNREGCRFCDETMSPEREIAVARQPGKQAFLLLDQQLVAQYSAWPHFISTAPKIAYAYVEDYLHLRPDIAKAAESVAELAQACDLPELPATIAKFNATSGRPLQGDRWVLLGPVRAYFTTTEGGASIDQRFRVLTSDGQPIPGLYAVGQNGLGGMILWSHGLHIAWALTSGRMAGMTIAESE